VSVQFSRVHTEAVVLSAKQRIARGESLLLRGQIEDALAIADTVLLQMPELASAQLLRGRACKALHRFAEAADAFRFILALFPDFAQMRVNLAHTCVELGDLEEAETQLQDAIARDPGFAPAHASLGSLYMRQDRFDLAEAPTRRALALDSTIVVAHQNLAAILALRNDSEARKHRDAAYHRQQIFIERSPSASRTALILTSSGSGNIPYLHLLPIGRYNRILWHLEYAPPGQEECLPPHDFVFNAVADPDAATEAQIAAERFVMECPSPVINRPDRVARTLRSAMPGLIGSLPDVAVPNTLRIIPGRDHSPEASSALGLRFPIILRQAGRHGGEDLRLIASPEVWTDLSPRMASYATEFVNYRSADNWYRKYRMIFVDRKPYPYHLAIGARWLLHYKSADMQVDAARRAEEAAFLRDPAAVLGPRAMTAIKLIAERLDLDYAGMDFSLMADGRLLFFEANAAMLVHPEDDPVFGYKNEAVETIIAAVEAMITRRLAR
jgi:Flp pilus assembly protein TadD